MEEEVQPSSPTVSFPIHLQDTIESLLHFILSSSVEEALEFDLGLSKEYCSNLLKDDRNKSNNKFDGGVEESDASQGVPPYPLYKRLASALHLCVTTGAFLKTSNAITSIQKDDFVEQNIDGWTNLFLDKGSELVKALESAEFELHVQEPFFSQLRGGLKTIEGRCATGNYNRIKSGSLLLFNKRLLLQVLDVTRYTSFFEMLETESLAKVLPGVKTVVEGVQIYRNFYTEEKEKSNGVLALHVFKPVCQPYILLANGLGYEGIGNLLRLARTVGTDSELLYPLR